MQGLLTTVIAVTIIGRIIKLSLPDAGNTKKYVSFLIGLSLCALMFGPLSEFFSAIGNGFSFDLDIPNASESEFEGIFEENIKDGILPSVEDYIYKELLDRFGVKREDCILHIDFSVDGDVLALKSINMFFVGSARFKDTGKICDYFEERFSCRVDIALDID